MIQFYRIGETLCFSNLTELPYEKIEEPRETESLTWLFEREPGSCRASFLVNDEELLWAGTESVAWLNKNRLEENAKEKKEELPAWVRERIRDGAVRAVNHAHPRFHELLNWQEKKGKKRVHVLAIGDVGSMLLTGLHLLGGDVISSIGICDLSEQVTARWEFEVNQIAYPWEYDALPEVDVVPVEKLTATFLSLSPPRGSRRWAPA